MARAATHSDPAILNQSIGIGWCDGTKSRGELAGIIGNVTGRSLSVWTVPWFLLRILVRPLKLFSDLGYDMLQMFLFFRSGRFLSDIARQERFFFDPAPTAQDAITRRAGQAGLGR